MFPVVTSSLEGKTWVGSHRDISKSYGMQVLPSEWLFISRIPLQSNSNQTVQYLHFTLLNILK